MPDPRQTIDRHQRLALLDAITQRLAAHGPDDPLAQQAVRRLTLDAAGEAMSPTGSEPDVVLERLAAWALQRASDDAVTAASDTLVVMASNGPYAAFREDVTTALASEADRATVLVVERPVPEEMEEFFRIEYGPHTRDGDAARLAEMVADRMAGELARAGVDAQVHTVPDRPTSLARYVSEAGPYRQVLVSLDGWGATALTARIRVALRLFKAGLRPSQILRHRRRPESGAGPKWVPLWHARSRRGASTTSPTAQRLGLPRSEVDGGQ